VSDQELHAEFVVDEACDVGNPGDVAHRGGDGAIVAGTTSLRAAAVVDDVKRDQVPPPMRRR
jgi:hypothetical protein